MPLLAEKHCRFCLYCLVEIKNLSIFFGINHCIYLFSMGWNAYAGLTTLSTNEALRRMTLKTVINLNNSTMSSLVSRCPSLLYLKLGIVSSEPMQEFNDSCLVPLRKLGKLEVVILSGEYVST